MPIAITTCRRATGSQFSSEQICFHYRIRTFSESMPSSSKSEERNSSNGRKCLDAETSSSSSRPYYSTLGIDIADQ